MISDLTELGTKLAEKNFHHPGVSTTVTFSCCLLMDMVCITHSSVLPSVSGMLKMEQCTQDFFAKTQPSKMMVNSDMDVSEDKIILVRQGSKIQMATQIWQ